MLKFYHKLQQKPKTVPEFKNAFQLIWSTLPEKAIDNTVKDYTESDSRHMSHDVCQPTVGILNI